MFRLTFLFIYFFALPAFSQSWELIWSDEFEGSSLNTCIWTIETGNGQWGWGTGQVDFATGRPENVRVENGSLILEVHKETNYWGQDYWGNWQQWNYTSGRIITRDKAFFKYGKIEAKLKIHEGQGIGAAFWMLPQYEVHGGWPKSGEIDIMETNGHEVSTNHGTVHYEQWGWHQYSGKDTVVPGNLHTEFHVYAIEWDDQWIKWTLNGQEFHRFSSSTYRDGRRPFLEDFFIILSTGVGSQYSGSVIDDSVLPTRIEVDYVRVYKPEGCCIQAPYGGTAHAIPGKIEAEHFDEGGRGLVYYDATLGNTGGVFRTEDVDLEACTDAGGGYNVGWTADNEWLRYTVNVEQSGNYNLDFRVASATGGGKIEIYNGCNWLRTLNVPNTGGWQNWQTYSFSNVYLEAGTQVLTLKFIGSGVNLNYFELSSPVSGLPVATDMNIQLYPSPFRNEIHISLPFYSKNAQIRLLNPQGVEFFSGETGSDGIIQIPSDMQSGLYFAEIITDYGVFIKKVVKE